MNDSLLRLVVKYRHRCFYCGKRTHEPTADHWIPRRNGGSNSFKNKVLACASCNHGKGCFNPVWIGLPRSTIESEAMEIFKLAVRDAGLAGQVLRRVAALEQPSHVADVATLKEAAACVSASRGPSCDG